jgi:hypothetical protein
MATLSIKESLSGTSIFITGGLVGAQQHALAAKDFKHILATCLHQTL